MGKVKAEIARNFDDAKQWGNNAKVLVSTEILYGFPMSWAFFYQVIFMRALGLGEILIGALISLPLMFQIILPMFGGYLADKFGRKRTLMTFDSIGLLGSLSLWYVAQGPLYVMGAMLFQGVVTTIYGVWETLLVEDTELSYRASIYSYIQLIYIFAGFMTPLAGAVISFAGLEQGCRYLFLIAWIAIATMLALRQIFLKESRIGKMLSSSNAQDESGLKSGYMETLRKVTSNKRLLIIFALTIAGSIQFTLTSTYAPLYLSDPNALALDAGIISVIPMASAIPSLIALSFIVPRLRQSRIKDALQLSYIFGLLGVIILVLAPRGNLALAIIYAILSGSINIGVNSILRVFLMNTIDEVDSFSRAKIMALITTFSALVTWPMPMVGGYLYTVAPSLPFVLSASSIVLGMLLLVGM
jgi:DHA1 family tetracycline resistance protein-like MFS transporter